MFDLYFWLNILLVLHLAGLIMGFIGGRTHGVILSRIAATEGETADMWWKYESQASNISFLGTAILIVSGSLMLWYKYGGLSGQETLFWIKMVLVVIVALAEIFRHQTAKSWKAGDEASFGKSRMWGKISGIAAVSTLIAGVFNFN